MRRRLLIVATILCGAGSLHAQGVKRPIVGGGSFGTGGTVVTPSKPTAPAKVRTVTYLSLTKNRQWLSSDGKSIMAMLVAFDAGDEKASVAPTVVKDDKIRLLKDKKVFLLPLGKLDPAHRAEVRDIEKQLAAAYKAKEAAPSQVDKK
jgi:hypothetical protein